MKVTLNLPATRGGARLDVTVRAQLPFPRAFSKWQTPWWLTMIRNHDKNISMTWEGSTVVNPRLQIKGVGGVASCRGWLRAPAPPPKPRPPSPAQSQKQGRAAPPLRLQ